MAALGCFAAVDVASADPSVTIDMSRVFDAGPRAQTTPFSSTLPDPPPLVERRQWLIDVRWDRGEVWQLGARLVDLHSPHESLRTMGRFALELYEGPALIERVRFNFPLLGGDAIESSPLAAVPFERKLRTRAAILFPATSRGNRLELWDRASNVRWSLPWPPLCSADCGTSLDGGAVDASPAIEGASTSDRSNISSHDGGSQGKPNRAPHL